MESEPLAAAGRPTCRTLCLERGLTVATAESCTGGLIAKLITDVAGSSGYFRGGIVAYANEAKERAAGRSRRAPRRPRRGQRPGGAGDGPRRVARGPAPTLAVAVTGVSGPGGGSAAKPVGLTYVAVASCRAASRSGAISGPATEPANREATARAALELLLECVTAAACGGGTGLSSGPRRRLGRQRARTGPRAPDRSAPGERIHVVGAAGAGCERGGAAGAPSAGRPCQRLRSRRAVAVHAAARGRGHRSWRLEPRSRPRHRGERGPIGWR